MVESGVADLLRMPGLTESQRAAVVDLAGLARTVDGVAPLSEQFLLDLRAGAPVTHLLGYAGGLLAGYAQVGRHGTDAPPPAELVVHPAHRRRGLGRALLAGMPRHARVWAHGDLPAARGFAAALGLSSMRELHLMGVGLAFLDGEAVTLPPGFAVRAFRPGLDDDAWVATNAAAFAAHPEQGRLTLADLHERMAAPWFDPAGLLLVHAQGPRSHPPLAAFHWTKIEPPDTPAATPPTGASPPAADRAPRVGEVYAVAVHPAYQGRGLGPVVTRLGLAHLRSRGCEQALLYVDADNTAAVRTYRGLGFATRHVDRMLALPQKPPEVRR